MATFESAITYGIGLETTLGTEATSYIGIPQEGLVKIPYGKRYESVKRFRGTPYKHQHDDIISLGREPMPGGFSHNYCFQTLIRLLAAMHNTPGTEVANVFTLTCPTAGTSVTEGVAGYGISVKQDMGSVNHAALGCVPKRIQLTFPGDGSAVKMSYEFAAMDSDDAADNDTLTIEASDIDLITSDFTFKIGAPAADPSPTQIYPAGDIVVTLEPEIESLRRGLDHFRQHCISGWGGSFEVRMAADSDPEEFHDYWKDKTRRLLQIIQGDGTHSEDGEITFYLHGTLIDETGQESGTILQESAKFELTGETTGTALIDAPYQIVYYDSAMT